MKMKNPLYVVKGKEVQEASSLIDLVIKKFNLEPLLKIIQSIFKMLLEQVKNYPSFIAVKEFIDDIIVKCFGLIKKFATA